MVKPIRYFENAEQRVASRLRLLQSALTHS
jgi:hypothetical protein